MRIAARIVPFLLVTVAACVVIDDPKHCWNRERDATCARIFDDPRVVCSRCLRGHSGCVDPEDAPSPAECPDPAASEESSDDGTSDAGSSSGDPSENPPGDRESSATIRSSRR